MNQPKHFKSAKTFFARFRHYRVIGLVVTIILSGSLPLLTLSGVASASSATTSIPQGIFQIQSSVAHALSSEGIPIPNSASDSKTSSFAQPGGKSGSIASSSTTTFSTGAGIVASGSLGDLGMGLPEPVAGSTGYSSSLGTTYDNQSSQIAATTEVLTGSSGRILTTFTSPQAGNSVSYPITLPAGASLSSNSDGSISVNISKPFTDSATGKVMGMIKATIGEITAPWAIDSHGNKLPTSYTLEGNTLVQSVDTVGASYPVTVDPLFTWGYISGTVYFNINETWELAWGSSYVSDLLSFAPAPFDFIGSIYFAGISAYAESVASAGMCVDIKVALYYAFIPYPGAYSGGYCS